MAKDILVNTNTGDFLSPDKDRKTQYFDVVWGNLFDGDDRLYMNIVVPYKYVDKLRYDENDGYICHAHADYYPDISYFFVRFVTRMSSFSQYINLHDGNNSIPTPSEALYYPEFTGSPQPIRASQVQLIDENGYLAIVFKRFNNGMYTRAILCKGESIDFKIGGGDSQSAQLLAKCAPGKYYRFPTSGVDLTKYINSVVDHTALTDKLVSEFEKDNKHISEASFDNSDGNLDIVFTGANEADDEGLDDPDTLDLSLFRLSDDDYIRALCKSSQSMLADNDGFMNDVMSLSDKIIGMWDIGGECKLDSVNYQQEAGPSKVRISDTGIIADNVNGYMISSISCTAGRLYSVNYAGCQISMEEGYYVKDEVGTRVYYAKSDSLFMLGVGNEQYISPKFYSTCYSIAQQYRNPKNNRLFVPLKDCMAYYYAKSSSDDLNLKGYGVRPVSYEKGNFATVLAIVMHPNTGMLYGIISLDSVIDEVRINLKTSELFVIKHSKE